MPLFQLPLSGSPLLFRSWTSSLPFCGPDPSPKQPVSRCTGRVWRWPPWSPRGRSGTSPCSTTQSSLPIVILNSRTLRLYSLSHQLPHIATPIPSVPPRSPVLLPLPTHCLNPPAHSTDWTHTLPNTAVWLLCLPRRETHAATTAMIHSTGCLRKASETTVCRGEGSLTAAYGTLMACSWFTYAVSAAAHSPVSTRSRMHRPLSKHSLTFPVLPHSFLASHSVYFALENLSSGSSTTEMRIRYAVYCFSKAHYFT